MQKTTPISSNDEVIVYVRASRKRTLACFAVIRTQELSKEFIENASDSITNTLTEYYGGKKITSAIDMISLFCVDRVTPAFQNLVNGNIQQGLKNGRLPVGLSFGGKTIYIAKQKDGFAIAKYKRMRRELVDIMNLPSIR